MLNPLLQPHLSFMNVQACIIRVKSLAKMPDPHMDGDLKLQRDPSFLSLRLLRSTHRPCDWERRENQTWKQICKTGVIEANRRLVNERFTHENQRGQPLTSYLCSER